jgi:transposase
VNRIIAQFRRHGVFIKEADFASPEERGELLRRLPARKLLQEDVACLLLTYDAITDQEEVFRQGLVSQAQRIQTIRRFEKLPGVGWIRAATFYAYIDTPWRFRSKSALWKYLGIGLERKHSGSGLVRLQACRQFNRPLKAMILGAALTAIAQGENPFADQHQRWLLKGGLSARIARRNVARSLAATMWGM